MLQWCSKHWFSSWRCGAFKGAPTPRAARRCRPIPRPGTSVTRPGSVARCCRACRSVGCPPSWPWTSCASWWVHQSVHLPTSWQIRHDHAERLLCFACCRERLQTVAYTLRRLVFSCSSARRGSCFCSPSSEKERGTTGVWRWSTMPTGDYYECYLRLMLSHIYFAAHLLEARLIQIDWLSRLSQCAGETRLPYSFII